MPEKTFDERLLGFVNQLLVEWNASPPSGEEAFSALRKALDDNGLKLAEFVEDGDAEEEG